jgi:hypothetical protein
VRIDEVENDIVSGYQVLTGNPADTTSWMPALEQHQASFGRVPEMASSSHSISAMLCSGVHLSQCNSSQFELIWVTNAKRLQPKRALFLRLYIGLFRVLCGHRCLLAAGRHDVLDPHVGHEVSVMFPVVYVVEVQHA